jgi:glutathione S-transferase
LIHLFQPPPPGWPNIGNMSPFCLKLEMWLRMAELPHKVRFADIRKAPKGKIPWIHDDNDNVTMGDSGLIIDHLKTRYGVKMDDHLSAEQRALSVAIQRMLEEHLYFGALVTRWGSDSSYDYVLRFFKKILPPVIGGLIMKKVRKQVLSQAHFQGIGRHNERDLDVLMRSDIDALSTFLGDKKFIHGDTPTSIDAVSYGFLANLMWVPWDNSLKAYAREKSNLVSYLERLHDIYLRKGTHK